MFENTQGVLILSNEIVSLKGMMQDYSLLNHIHDGIGITIVYVFDSKLVDSIFMSLTDFVESQQKKQILKKINQVMIDFPKFQLGTDIRIESGILADKKRSYIRDASYSFIMCPRENDISSPKFPKYSLLERSKDLLFSDIYKINIT